MILKLAPCGVTTMKSELEMGHTKHSLLKVILQVKAIQCSDPRWIAQNFGFLKMSNFDICVVHLSFEATLGDPKFGAIHVGLHLVLLWPATLD